MLDLSDKSFCSGCTACLSICPQKCIEIRNEKGFLYPNIDKKKCIDCDSCVRVCPIQTPKDSTIKSSTVFAFQNSNDEDRKKSTSGGFFLSVAREIIDNGGKVWAAGFDEDMNVVHKRAEKSIELYSLYGSKYVQSNLQNTFGKIKKELTYGETILFAGTPCQVEGLLNFIDDKYCTNLYTLDFYCYGVPSPELYKEWIDWLNKKYNCKVKYINFRDKKYGYFGVNTQITFENGRILEDKVESKLYLKTMFSNIGLRDSCYNCVFRNRVKRCDFTLGDMWEVGQYNSKMDDDLGTTKVHVNTKKGQELYERLKGKASVRIKTLTRNELESETINKNKQKPMNALHKEFVSDIGNLEFPDIVNKYFPITTKDKVVSMVKPMINLIPFSHYIFRKIKFRKIKKQNG